MQNVERIIFSKNAEASKKIKMLANTPTNKGAELLLSKIESVINVKNAIIKRKTEANAFLWKQVSFLKKKTNKQKPNIIFKINMYTLFSKRVSNGTALGKIFNKDYLYRLRKHQNRFGVSTSGSTYNQIHFGKITVGLAKSKPTPSNRKLGNIANI